MGKNLAFFKPDKKGRLLSAILAIDTLFRGVFSLLGEKIINRDGHTLGPEEEYYGYEYSSRTYLYFLLGFFLIPIGTIIFLLFIVEYHKKEDSEINKDNNESKEKEAEMINKKSISGQNTIKEDNNDNNEQQNEIDDKNKNKEKEEFILNKKLKTINKNRNIKKVIKTFRFWRLSFVQFFLSFAFSFIIGTGRTFGALIGINGTVLQYLMLSHSGALIIFGPILGIITDKKGPLIILRITTLLCMIPGILLTFFTRNPIIFVTSFIIAALGITSTIVIFAPLIMEIYGIQESVILVGIMGIFSRISEVITTVAGFVFSLFYSKDEIFWFVDIPNVSTFKGMKRYLNTSRVITMRSMFYHLLYVEELDLSGFDTHNVQDMSVMFGSMSYLA